MPSDTAKPNGLNLRKAEAGLNMLADPSMSQRQALLAAGYAESTACIPKKAGLSVESCIAEAAKLNPDVAPAKLVERARRLFGERIDRFYDRDGKPIGERLDKARLSEVARMAEVAEKYYAGHSTGNLTARDFVDRLEWMADLQQELQRRKTARQVIDVQAQSQQETEPTEK